jgi:NTE family protein
MTEGWRELARHEVNPLDPIAAWRVLRESWPWDLVGGLLRATGTQNWVFTVDPVTITLAALGLRNYFVPSRNQRQMLRDGLPVQRLEECRVPVHLMAADVLTGAQVALQTGDAVDAVLASAAIPAVFPNVTIGGEALMDGGTTANTAIDHALTLGADTIYVLPCGFSCGLRSVPRTVLDMAMHAFNVMLEQQLIVALGQPHPGVELLVVPPLCPVSVSGADFSATDELIERAERATKEWLANGHQPVAGLSRALGGHRHRH